MNSSKLRRNRKTVTAGAVLLAVMLATAACGSDNNDKKASGQPDSVNEGAVVDKLPNESGIMDPDVSKPDATPNDNNEVTKDPDTGIAKTSEGIYVGLMDSHSIEIETATGAMPLQITEELADKIEALPADTKVIFEYREQSLEGEADMKQYWLVSIEQVK